MRPVIAISACSALDDYIEAVRQAGGEPRVVGVESGDAEAALDGAVGLVLSGGGDVDPRLYGETPHASHRAAEAGRDSYELTLARTAVNRDMPVLAICRGLQVLNVACGGNLIQDIPTEVAGAVRHHLPNPKDADAHDIQIAAGSRLAALLGDRVATVTCHVNSRHHQAVNQAGEGLTVVARSPDGVVEAVERPRSRFCLGVQWHPENFWRRGDFQPLFKELVKAASGPGVAADL